MEATKTSKNLVIEKYGIDCYGNKRANGAITEVSVGHIKGDVYD